jgi:hypothetical protein
MIIIRKNPLRCLFHDGTWVKSIGQDFLCILPRLKMVKDDYLFTYANYNLFFKVIMWEG